LTKSAPIDLAPLKNPPEGAPIAEGQLVTHKPRTSVTSLRVPL
jgi:hypothetical protein